MSCSQVNDKETEVLTTHLGTRFQLLTKLRETYRQVIYHWTLKALTRHILRLDVATFSGADTIIVLTDFAATAKLKGAHMRTCEHPTTANEDVAIVLYSPGTAHAHNLTSTQTHTHTDTHTHTHSIRKNRDRAREERPDGLLARLE